MEGILHLTMKGVGYVTVEGVEQDVFIDAPSLGTGLDGDRVAIKNGKVVRVLARARDEFVGTVERKGKKLVALPDNRKIQRPMLLSGAHPPVGTKVLVRITDWNAFAGAVVRNLGIAGAHETEIQAILAESRVAGAFPKSVEEEAARLPEAIPEEEIAKRRDFRAAPTFTIDPADAKDFDDALSVREMEPGIVEVGVHIADVSHYVRPGTALDREAERRGTSIYLVDRVIPMLPERLSNDLCSLVAGRDRLTFSAVFTLDRHAKILSRWFGKTVIHSQKRYTYEDAQKTLDAKAGMFHDELQTLRALARIMRAERERSGAISFESDEVKFELDAKGKPVRIVRKERGDTHLLVEDWMLLANRAVAEEIFRDGKERGPFVYRVHDFPNFDKLSNLALLVRTFGHELELTPGDVPDPKELNRLMRAVLDTPEEHLVHLSVIRSMAKAVYSAKNIGHYGLAYASYTHFTSPIRRYPDCMVHRLLAQYLSGKGPSDREAREIEKKCAHASEMELRAMEAERASVKYKSVEYLSSRIGQIYEGVITGVANWGIYVETAETRCEGMIRLRDLKDDFYMLDEKQFALIGERTRKKYRVGDSLRVKVKTADLKTRTIDFTIVEKSK